MPMIEKNMVVKLEYTATLDGNVVSHTHKPKLLLIGHERDLPPGLEAAVLGKTAPLELTATYTYPAPDQSKVISVPATQLPIQNPEIGAKFTATDPNGQNLEARVVAVDSNMVTIDMNPLRAGKNLEYQIRIHDVRPADAHELEHGHAHGEGGVVHHHH
jgi:FKBP-type peptidyl-prolyl cis-trans isomerase SlyD